MTKYKYTRNKIEKRLVSELNQMARGGIDTLRFYDILCDFLAPAEPVEKEKNRICRGGCKCPDCHYLGDTQGNVSTSEPKVEPLNLDWSGETSSGKQIGQLEDKINQLITALSDHERRLKELEGK